MNKCQQCGEPAQTTLCKTCAKHMRRQITSLAKTIPELRALAERKAHIGERGGGVRGGEPGLPVSVHWLTVYEDAARLMLRLAGCINLKWMLLPVEGWRPAYRSVCRSWSRDRAGLRTTRKQVSNWLTRGRLSKARRIGRGMWEFNQAELVDTRLAQEGESA